MIQFNLLPDVKINYLKTQVKKRFVVIISIAVSSLAVLIFVGLFISVRIVQKNKMNKTSAEITSQLQTLKSTPDLDKILTIQNQLNKLTELHDSKPVATRLFDYIQKITPTKAYISGIKVDFLGNQISLSGTTDTLINGNKFADTLKFATYESSKGVVGKPFSNVVSSINAGKGDTSFGFTMNFDPILFNVYEVVSLKVPNIISTRSETEKPSSIFKESTTKTGGQ